MNNVAYRLASFAKSQPDQIAVVEPLGYYKGKRQYKTITFRALDEDSDRIAYGLNKIGVQKGMRMALLVTPGIDFVSCVFGLLKSGAVMILIDPGMGKGNLLQCLQDANPDGFVAISKVQALWRLMWLRFPNAEFSLTVGKRWFWGGPTLEMFRENKHPGSVIADVAPEDPAAIIFTTGSTGPPKGVLYQHQTFNTQVAEISKRYNIHSGQVDLPGFPMFGLFNCAMGSTAVIPDMDASRPAQVNPLNILEAVEDWNVSQSFGSPAIWKAVGQWCETNGRKLENIRMILTAGAPASEEVLRCVKGIIHPEGEIHTPYGATEALPVATISASEVLNETIAQTREGAGVCVGRKFDSIEWKIIKITEEPIETLDLIEELPTGEIGELLVTGPQITREYVTHCEANRLAKIRETLPDGSTRIWHRMGDVGYFDEQKRFWFCGRKAHRVETPEGTYFSIPVEAIFNSHPQVSRSALVGVGEGAARRPIIIIEPRDSSVCASARRCKKLGEELLQLASEHEMTKEIQTILFHPAFPVDIRHNAKIFREKLAIWAEKNA
ncbi:MAG: fatty acid CoA ligase family protein [Planctomycetia bacterium]|nr:fatty acid CoA ligase family protein [Planctomycetia bacterium]